MAMSTQPDDMEQVAESKFASDVVENASTSSLALSASFIDEQFNGCDMELEEPLASVNFNKFCELTIDGTPCEIFDRIYAPKDEKSFIVDWHKQRKSNNLNISDWNIGHTLDNEYNVDINDPNISKNIEKNMVFYSKLSKSNSNLIPKYYNYNFTNKQPIVYKRIISFQTKVFDFGFLNKYLPNTSDIFSTLFARFWGNKKLLITQWCSTSNVPYSSQFFVIHRYEFELIKDEKNIKNIKKSKGSVFVGFYWIKPLKFLQSAVEYAIASQTKKELSVYLKQIQIIFNKNNKNNKNVNSVNSVNSIDDTKNQNINDTDNKEEETKLEDSLC